MLHVEYEFREEDLVHFNQMRFMQTEDYRENMKKNRLLVPGAMFFIAAFYYFYYHDLKTTIYIVILAALWSVFSPRILLLDIHRRILSKYTYKEKHDMFGMYTLSINPEDPHFLHEKSPSGKNKMAWKDLIRIERTPNYVYIYIDLSTALVIPVATVKSGNIDEFAKQAEKMIERNA